MQFSERTGWQPGMNAWAEAVDKARAAGRPLIDLTLSNPIACGLGPDSLEWLHPLSAPGALQYDPEPLGTTRARQAVVDYYHDHRATVPLRHICLTTSTSEAYNFLFRLLCDPGDEVLIARPSYPLFDLLAALDDVQLRAYPLFYEPGAATAGEGWLLDFTGMEAQLTPRTRALIVVHPNNPTGHFVSKRERRQLLEFCAARGLALIVDEVFLDYQLAGPAAETFAGQDACLCFTLSGLSKVCALPQMKASWVVTSGPRDLVEEALRRLEIVADTFLSVNAPVQAALPVWLGRRAGIQNAIRQRLRENLASLETRLKGSLGEVLVYEGGWTAVLRVPRVIDEDSFPNAALHAGVLIQPGHLYGLPEGRCVLSLLIEPEKFLQGIGRLPL